jgi:hypothetical protein
MHNHALEPILGRLEIDVSAKYHHCHYKLTVLGHARYKWRWLNRPAAEGVDGRAMYTDRCGRKGSPLSLMPVELMDSLFQRQSGMGRSICIQVLP